MTAGPSISTFQFDDVCGWSCPTSAVKNLVFRADKPVETAEKPMPVLLKWDLLTDKPWNSV
jgi:hypothetical protein